MNKPTSLLAVVTATGLSLLAIACSSVGRVNTLYSLAINSVNSANGVSIAVSQPDVNGAANGTTSFTRAYSPGTRITFTAPVSASGQSFSSWTGCTSSSGIICTVTVTANATVTAAYVTPPLIAPSVTLAPSQASITTAQTLGLTVSVNGDSGNPIPTGSVVLTSGSYTSAAATLSSGSTIITVPGSSLAIGINTLTATYTPDSASSATYKSATGTNTVTVTINMPQPTVTLTASPTSITPGASSTLTWTSSNATSCAASGGWSGTEDTNGTQIVAPTVTTSYTLTCDGDGGSANASATVAVGTGWFVHIDCENGAIGTQVAQGGADEFTQTFSSTLYSNAEVGTGSESCQMGITQGSDGWGQWGASYVFPSPLQNGSELWVRVSLFVPAGFDMSTNDGMLKFMRVLTASPGVTDEGYHDLLVASPGFESWSSGIGNWTSPYIYNFEGAANLIGVGTVSANSLAAGQWETYEMYLKFSPVGKDAGGQGEIRIWKNNQLLLDRTSAPTLVQSTSFAELFYVFTYWNGNAPATQSLYVDDIELTNQTPANRDANGYPFIGTPVMTSSSGTVVNGVCGSANGVAVTNPPDSNLCSSGTASVVSDSGPWAWMCIGSNGGTTTSCSTNPALVP